MDEDWNGGGTTAKVLIEVATAWAVMKALLPVRLAVCVWGTPWFARVAVLPVMGWFARIGRFGGKMGVVNSRNAAGTGATGGRVLP